MWFPLWVTDRFINRLVVLNRITRRNRRLVFKRVWWKDGSQSRQKDSGRTVGAGGHCRSSILSNLPNQRVSFYPCFIRSSQQRTCYKLPSPGTFSRRLRRPEMPAANGQNGVRKASKAWGVSHILPSLMYDPFILCARDIFQKFSELLAFHPWSQSNLH